MSDHIKKKTNKTIGKNIRTFRHQHGWSQEDVANRLGISIPAFSKIETGVTDINLSRLEQIADIYEIDVAQILSIVNFLKPRQFDVGITDFNLSRLEQIADIYEIDVAQILSIDAEELEQQ